MVNFGSPLNTGITGLAAAQRAMTIIGQNVANANTPGYSRQRVTFTASGPSSGNTLFTGQQGSFGGVNVSSIVRVHDAFLQATLSAAQGQQAALQAESTALTGTQQLLNEPGTSGLQSSLDAFWSAWGDLANNPTDVAAGAVVIQDGIAVTHQLQATMLGLTQLWNTAHDNLASVVDQVNVTAQQLADLNTQISVGESGQRSVNELLDQRDQLAGQLSQLIGATVLPGAGDEIGISVNGITIVAGGTAQKLTMTGGLALSTAAADPPTLRWGNTAVNPSGGTAAGLLATVRTDLPHLSDTVDSVAVALRDAVNGQHTAGFTLSGAAGGDFFTGTNASDLTVAVSQPAELAVAAAANTIDGANAQRIGDLADDQVASAALGGLDGPSAQWRKLVSSVGAQVQGMTAALNTQGAVVSAASDAMTADSGVNIDEEMTNMLLFQRAYQANARVLTTADQMLDTLINRTGVVGL